MRRQSDDRELRDLMAVSTLIDHITHPCERDLLPKYLANLKTLVKTTPFKYIRDMGQAALTRGKEYYQQLVDGNREPPSSVIR
jgi:hypothetical protein